MQDIILLNDIKFKGIINLPLLKIEPIESKIDLEKYDALIFTSKNAVYTLNSFSKSWQKIASYAIAPKTADVIRSEGGYVAFTGITSHGDNFAYELIPLFKNKKVLYIKALKTVSNLVAILKENNILVDELVTYKTSCSDTLKEIVIKNNSIIIFSSPSTIDCFFKKYSWNNTFKAIVIGKTTASHMPKEIKYIISPSTALKKCIEVAKSL